MTVWAVDADTLIVTAACYTLISMGSGPWPLNMNGAAGFDRATWCNYCPARLLEGPALNGRRFLYASFLPFDMLRVALFNRVRTLPFAMLRTALFYAQGIGSQMIFTMFGLQLPSSMIPIAAFSEDRGRRAGE